MTKFLANGAVEVRFDERGEFDELCIKSAMVHLEMMDDRTLWIGFYIPGREYPIRVWVKSKNRLSINCYNA